ncbi:MAG: M12 family metallo-peptidase [Acidobacteria bacterium]|nr:M12 family metallo-peptidase [Acidobacteriota bacterium]
MSFLNQWGIRNGLLWSCVAIAMALFSHSLQGQAREVDDAWAEVQVSEEKAADGSPESVTIYRLDDVKFDGFLRSAPAEGSGAVSLFVKLPMPDGKRSLFRVEESPIMEPGLAARFPTIRTFTLRGVDDPSITGRMDRNHRNLHVLLLTPQGAVQINPDSRLEHPNYRSVYEKTSASDIFCGVETIPALVQSASDASTSGNLLRSGLSNAKAAFEPAALASGATLSTYRLAIATTGEYYNGWESGGGDADVLAAVTTVVNRLNAVYEVEVAIRFTLINNTTDVFFTDGTTDGYSDGAPCTMRNENTPIINLILGAANYDVAHVFGMQGGGGCAGGSVVCDDLNKGNGASGLSIGGDPAQEGFGGYRLLSHEMGHQFSAGHSWSGSNGSCTPGQFSPSNAYEPLSGSTLMAYSGICGADNVQGGVTDDPYFHTRSFDQIVSFSTGVGAGAACASTSATGNAAPSVNAGPDYTIPQQTPFILTGSATDPDGDPLSYAWEQFDVTAVQISPLTDMGSNPLFRSFLPLPNDPSRTFPQLSDILNNTTTTGELLPTMDRTMNFCLTARDNLLAGGGVDYDGMVVTVSGDPFFLTAPDGGETLNTGCSTDVTWQVGGGSIATNVNLLLSEDGGQNFSPWAASTLNDGSESLTVPCNAATTQGRAKAEAVDNIFFDISDGDFTIEENVPVITGSATGGEVDDACMFEVTFQATVTDDCSVAEGDVSVNISELTGNATLGAPTVNIVQGDGTTVNVTGSVIVSGLTSSPATVRVAVTGTDGCGLQTVESFDADVADTTPPSIDVVLDPSSIWPPTHKMYTISADVTVEDNCPVTDFILTSVMSDEPDDDTGDGATTDDIQDAEVGTADTSFSVRAERKGNGDGRIYTASYNVMDGSGNEADGSATVEVKHSKKK